MSRGLDVGFLGSVDFQSSAAGGAGAAPVPVLIRRVFYRTPGTFTATAPDGATRCRARCLGAGGSVQNNFAQTPGAGGGAYAAGNLPVANGQTGTVIVGAGQTGFGDGGDSRVVFGTGTVLAKGGRGAASGGGGGAGGDKNSCLGDIRRSGGAGSATNTGTAGTGEAGGAGGSGTNQYNDGSGGGSAGDLTDADTFTFGGVGAGFNGNTAVPAGPGGGGVNANGVSAASQPFAAPGPGLVILEYWSV